MGMLNKLEDWGKSKGHAGGCSWVASEEDLAAISGSNVVVGSESLLPVLESQLLSEVGGE